MLKLSSAFQELAVKVKMAVLVAIVAAAALAPGAAVAQSAGCARVNAGSLNYRAFYSSGDLSSTNARYSNTFSEQAHNAIRITATSDPTGGTAHYDTGGSFAFAAGDVLTLTVLAQNVTAGTVTPRFRVGTTATSAADVAGTEAVVNIDGTLTRTYTVTGSETSIGVRTAKTTGTTPSGQLWVSVTCAPAPSAPTVTSVSPTSGQSAGGTSVTITGTGFTTASTVAFDGVSTTDFTVDSATRITAVTPPGSPGPVTVDVVNAVGTGSLAAGYTYLAAPTISAVGPAEGMASATTRPANVTITGTNFSASGNSVTFGGASGTIVSESPTSIVATPPANATGGLVDVRVVSPGGSVTATGAYRYILPPVMTVTFSPDAVALNGRTAFTLTVTNPNGVALQNIVLAKDNLNLPLFSETVTSRCGTSSTASLNGGISFSGQTLAAGASCTLATEQFAFGAGTFQFVPGVLTSSGTPTTALALVGAPPMPSTLTIYAPPSIVGISPNNGPLAGGQSVTLTGTGFTGATAVTIDGVAATNVTVDSDTSITVTTPPGASAGYKAVQVTGPGGSQARQNAYLYNAAPPPPTVVAPNNLATTGLRPTYRGSASSGYTVTVHVDGVAIGTAVADGSGWSLQQPVDLSAGPHTVYATAFTALLGTSEPSSTISFTTDVTPPAAPTVTSPAEGARVNTATPTLEGAVEAGARVEVYVDGARVTTRAGDTTGGGTWTFTSPALSQGSHTVHAIAEDAAGNRSPQSATNSFIVDTIAPPTPVILSPGTANVIYATSAVLGGSAEAFAEVRVYADGAPAGTTTADAGGAWSYTLAASGAVQVTVEARDQAGNLSGRSPAYAFTFDGTPLAAPVVATPADGSHTRDRTPTFTGTAAANARVAITTGGIEQAGVNADGAGAWSVDLPVQAEGQYIYQVTATRGGSTSPGRGVSLRIDATAPAAPTLSAPVDDGPATVAPPVFSGTAEPLSQVELQLNGEPVASGVAVDGAGAWTLALPADALETGVYVATVTSRDAAGNVSPASGGRTFTIDRTAPAVPDVIAPMEGESVPNLPGMLGRAEAGSQVTVVIDGVDYTTVEATDRHDWYIQVTGTPLAEGPHTVAVRAADALGNTSALSTPVNFTVDTVAPAAPVIASPTDGQVFAHLRPTFSGTAEPNATVHLTFTTPDGYDFQYVPVDGAGHWSFAADRDLPEGAVRVQAIAYDYVGNLSPAVTLGIVLDASPPAMPTISTPTEGSTSASRSVVLAGTAEADATVVIVLDGATLTATADGGGDWRYTAANLADGAHAFTVQARDQANFTSPVSSARSFSVDATAPAAPTILSPVDGALTGDATPVISGTTEAGASVAVLIDGVAAGTAPADAAGAWSFTSGVLADGPHTVSAVSTDAARNASPASAPIAFTVDATAPAAPVISAPVDGSVTDDGTPTVSGTADGDATVLLSINGAAPITVAVNGGAWSYTPPSDLPSGENTLSAVAMDAAGNVSPASSTVRFTYSPLTITTTTLASGQVGVAYAADVQVAGGFAPYGFAVTAGRLPDGLRLSTAGALSGTPTASGAFSFTVTATDANGLSTGRALGLTVAPPAPPVVTDVDDVEVTANPGGAAQPTEIDLSRAVRNATRIEIVSPPGHGAATVDGFSVHYVPTFGYYGQDSFTYRAIGFDDAAGAQAAPAAGGAPGSVSQPATVTIVIPSPTLTLTGGVQPPGQVGVAYSQTLTAAGGAAPYTYAVTGGALPAGVSLAPDGTLSGAPTAGGAFSFTVTATDSATGTGPFSVSAVHEVTIAAPTLVVTPSVLPDATTAQPYSQAVSASGGVGPYGYAITAGALPTGLTLSPAGVLSGTPTQGGSFTFTVTATDSSTGAGPYSAGQALTLTVAASPIVVTPTALATGSRGTPYSATVSAAGGVAPYSYGIASGALPAGLALSPTGQISGTPTAVGTFTFQVRATDSATGAGPYSGVADVSVTIAAANLTVTPTSLPDVLAGVPYSQQLTATGGQGGYAFTVTAGALPAGLTLSPAGLLAGRPTTAGTFAFTVTATDGFGNTGSVALSLVVTGRPDPAADPDVRGLNSAQAEATRRMVGTQITTFGRRLEQLHGGGQGQNAVSLNLTLDGAAFTPLDESRAAMGELGQALARSEQGDGDRSGREELIRMVQAARGVAPESAPATADRNAAPQSGPGGASGEPSDGLRVWAGGAISLGDRDPTTQTAKMSITTSGISVGVDMSVAEGLDLGVGVGFGQENVDVGVEDSRLEADTWVGVAYGSWRPQGDLFLDGMLGYGELGFDTRRRTPVDRSLVFGRRDGTVLFGSLSAGIDRTAGGARWIGYGRVDTLDADLDGYAETGSPLWSLSYDARSVRSRQGTLGLRYERSMLRPDGRWTPGVRLEWTHEFGDADAQTLRYADWLDGPGFSIGEDGWNRSRLNLGLSFGWSATNGWSWTTEYEGAFSDGEVLNGLRVKLSRLF